ncbi:MAG: VanR-ABDEGLN family response regulator transcription factor [Treponema sp.]|jgi:two-component system response regulator VanR|nr:VanR-ABDEGLN family response regulator transcription factor [Treponema sp.]
MKTKVLIVDDEQEISDLVEIYLKNEGFDVLKAYTARTALDAVETYAPALAILDIMLPDMDGFALCAEIRKMHTFPIFMLTAKDTDMDKIHGLTMGADDYLTKPFNPLELVARVKAQIRRREQYDQTVQGKNCYESRGLSVNADSHSCSLFGKPLNLTPIEFSILWYLCQNENRVIPSEELFEAVWKEKYLDNNNTVMAHIARIREKMNEPSRKPKYIKTAWGVGYRIESEK